MMIMKMMMMMMMMELMMTMMMMLMLMDVGMKQFKTWLEEDEEKRKSEENLKYEICADLVILPAKKRLIT